MAGHVARVLARDRRVVVVAMGRGGPAEPELVETPPTLDDLLALSRSGRHAASDHLEAAALAGVPAVGCRRAGGGLAGAPFRVQRPRGSPARRAARAGAARLRRQRRRAAARRDRRADPRHERRSHDARAGLNAYRVLVSDLVVDTGGADREAIRSISDVPIVTAELRLRPAEPLRGRRTAVFTTGPAPTDELDARDRPRLAQPRAPGRAAGGARAGRRRGVPRRAQGCRGRRRGRGGARARRGGRPRRERCRLGRARRARAGPREAGGSRVNEPRRIKPLPLGGDELGLPYSRGLMARSLMAAGVAGAPRLRAREPGPRRAARARPRAVSTWNGSRRSRSRCSASRRDASRSQRLRRYQELRELDLPIMVLHRRRDRHRQVDGRDRARVPLRHHARHVDRLRAADDARVLLARRSCPSIHQSSFEAGDVYPDADDPVESGFLEQARNVLVGVRASSERALEEGWSLVLEGVHLVPGMVELPRPELARRRCSSCSRSRTRRSTCATSASATRTRSGAESRYLERFDDIRRLQEVIVARAERNGVPVIENEDADAGGADRRGPRPRRRRAESDGDAMSENAEYEPEAERPCQCQAYLRATERAALVSARWLGRADEDAAEEAAATGDAGDARRPADQRSRRLRLARRLRRAHAGRDRRLGRQGGRPRARPARGPRRRRARRQRRDVDDRRRRPRPLHDAPRHLHAEDGGRPARARRDRPAARRSARTSRRSPRRSGGASTT